MLVAMNGFRAVGMPNVYNVRGANKESCQHQEIMTAYYNELDPYPAQWLRNLITAGHIAGGSVDERDIRKVQPDDIKTYTQAHFFAGIGIWSYALRLAGWPDDRLAARLRPDLAAYQTITTKLSMGALVSFGVRRSGGTTLELRVNGHGDGRVSSGEVGVDLSAAGADIVLGAGADETPPCCSLIGGIAEVVAIHGPLSGDDLGRLEAYLDAKYTLH